MALLGRNDLIAALTRLGELASADGQDIELLIVGGGVMVMEFNFRESTRDLDGVVINMDAANVRRYAQAIAAENNWPIDWLNDGAKGFITGVTVPVEMFSAPGICVSRPRFEQLLAMKLSAWRDDVDIADASRLLLEMTTNKEQAWNLINPFLQPGRELKARYAFDDLWETRS